MEHSNEEFKSLLARSGWNQSEAARKLELTSASVSRYVNDIDKPTKQTLRLFRLLLAEELPSMRDAGPAYQVKAPQPKKIDVGKIRAQIKTIRAHLDALEDEL